MKQHKKQNENKNSNNNTKIERRKKFTVLLAHDKRSKTRASPTLAQGHAAERNN